ncbi:MAG TPA: sodium:solute symporter family protein [Vicinamibacterales bacterium]|nr:sodium:solute symporter family protein [Vicinamibacterales bacterium]
MIPAAIVFGYLAIVLYIGIFAFRHRGPREGAEDYFLAGRSLGPVVFLLSLFGTNMTAFTILGSAGHAFSNGIVTFGLMASASAFVIPLTLFFIGTRMWALGKRHGFMTPVQMFRHRWECGHIGTVIFAVQAALLVPYIIIGVMGGGTALRATSGGVIPYWFGGAVVALVVMSYVFFGGMRGTAWVNTFQTVLFLSFGALALVVIGSGMGGFPTAVESLIDSPSSAHLLTRERISPLYFFSYTFIPLSTIAFPHITIFCLTARRMGQFRRTVIFYPLCILAIWLPCVFLGVAANALGDVPAIERKLAARQKLAAAPPSMPVDERTALQRQASGDDVIPIMLDTFAPLWLAGVLGAGIMAAVMASDSQILALSTMFTEDVFAYYGAKARFGEAAQVHTGRLFVVILTVVAYTIALQVPPGIFNLAVQYAFSGYAALSPLLVAALFWNRSTKWGALAVALWTACAVIYTARVPGALAWLGLLPVVPMTLVSCVLMVVVSLLTRPPSAETIGHYGLRRPA